MLHVTNSRNVAAARDTAAGDMNAGQEHDKPGLELVHSQHELVHSQHELVQLVHPLLLQ